ncbi:pyridoxamine 5'-phosphate oxidase family protein [Janibacter hoylei]|jgi:general stress protein 26|uniref:Pyridoxamine 5'-phosphate oxidase family protein n=2 Tax=Janibacter TaxID=53457 RepID=A0A7L9J0Z4_9MICO|nr:MULTISPECIES: pyridoxamine 5'-phosphate oxidase family protein [Janibacter]EKA61254.1 stress protein (general stress protein 26) [Janibacter hoylei PVAS-1]MCW4601930.1 pyridoxamine 5'-phosphate oxidase family protein [Janibacter hoylei]QOK23034.1 pyridoxamine 5'-phosphate oxidase family protein [Janibacter indicus]RWU82802.1 pyridoxamine 5'-phosphate oxidase [Janibacter hoylei PVAS-1]UTT66303.1 pyridoxamine 5'-phosphate oxidase family protein [Janibacter sp. CX7]
MSETEIETVATIMRETRIAVLTHVEDGRLVSVPMGTQDLDDPGTIHFITEADTDKVRAIAAHPEVNIAYATDDGWVSVSGTARRNDDRELLGRLWDASAGAFMEGGPDDPNSTLITVTADTARYWTSPGTVATVVQMAKGLVSDGRPDLGDTGTVSL